MKKYGKSTKKGFTLVELIVVLVILAVLAAMLVPALTGYIRRARQEKDYQFAATVLTAAQSAATYQYSLPATSRTTPITEATPAGNDETVQKLVGNTGWTCSFTVDDNFVINGGWVKIGDNKYEWNPSTSTWTATSS